MAEKSDICEMLRRLEEALEAGAGEIAAAEEGLFHIRRAMELIRCSPRQPTIEEEKLFRRGIIVE